KDVKIYLSGESSTFTISKSDGSYKFVNISSGKYTLTPKNGSYTFDSDKKEINLFNENATLGTDFIAYKKYGYELWAWGSNVSKIIDTSSNQNYTIPKLIDASQEFLNIKTNSNQKIAIKSNGTLWSSSYKGSSFPFERFDINLILQNNDIDWKEISIGSKHLCAMKEDGSLYSWGENVYKQCYVDIVVSNQGPESWIDSPLKVLSNFSKIVSNYIYSVGIKFDGSLMAWGRLSELGDIKMSIETNWFDVSAGHTHILMLKKDNSLWSIGNNLFGELGDGTYESKKSTVRIGSDNDWKIISGGTGYSLAIKTDGTLWAWGKNDFGQLGDGTNINRNIPVQIGTNNDWKVISAGENHSLALKMNGELWSWGKNSFGQLGNNDTLNINKPIQIGTNRGWTSISAGYDCSFALSKSPLGVEDEEIDLHSIKFKDFNETLKIEGLDNIEEVIVYNLLGSKLTSTKTNGNSYYLSKTELNNGIYLIRVKSNNQFYNYKMIVNK
ncbi:MAG: T9SS type A sorting domain-containing protein, partial [Candidatus Kapabacteria bacterium]|nr:T9SS type A sorting domain-containing protein [Candidatus Kapabacteria bacterium]